MRVTIQHAEGGFVIMMIEGKIAGPHAPELYRAWQELAPSLGEKKLLVDLRGVLHVDVHGRQVLADMHARAGAEFVADTPLTKFFAEQAQRDVRRLSNLE